MYGEGGGRDTGTGRNDNRERGSSMQTEGGGQGNPLFKANSPGTKTFLSSIGAVCSGLMWPVYSFHSTGTYLVNLSLKMPVSRKGH